MPGSEMRKGLGDGMVNCSIGGRDLGEYTHLYHHIKKSSVELFRKTLID